MGNKVTITIAGDSKSLEQALGKSQTAFEKFENGLNKASVVAGAALAAIGVGAKMAIDSASALEQSFGGVDAVFKDSADVMHQWAKEAANNFGLSENAANEFAAVLGAQLKNAGTPLDQVAAKTQNLVALGADLAATYGGTTADAVAALSSALKGEMDPIEKYGISLNMAMLQAKALEMGIKESSSTWDIATKQQVILAAVMDQSKDAMGQFAAQSDTLGEQQQILDANFENLKATIGEKLLPVAKDLSQWALDAVGWMKNHKDLVVGIATVIGVFAGAIITLNVALKAYEAIQAAIKIATSVWTGIQWLLNAALTANPIGIIIVAIGALIAIIVLIATKTTWFQDLWNWAWGGIKAAAAAVWDWLKGAWDWLGGAFDWLVQKFKDIPTNLKNNFMGLVDIITSPFRAAFNAVSDLWNNTIGRLSWSVPDWVPFIGGKTISAPQLPHFHTGGIVPGPVGQEVLAVLQAGERVVPVNQANDSSGTTVYNITVNGLAELQEFLGFTDNLRNNRRRGLVMA